jgi:hypothetical protein
VGAGKLPESLEPADTLTKGMYTPIIPVGRTVNAALTEKEKQELVTYNKAIFSWDNNANRKLVEQSSPSGKGAMPAELGRIFMPLHDELSKRTSGELPADFDTSIQPEWATSQAFDRSGDYEAGWLRYDKVDIYGEPLA